MFIELLKILFCDRRSSLLILSFFIASQAHAQTQLKTPDEHYELIQVEGNLYLAGVKGPGGHTTALLVTPEGVIMGDPIRADFAHWLKQQLTDRFDTEVKYVIYSHHHPDHASGGAVFADTANFVGHQKMRMDKMPSNFAALDTNNNGLIELEETTVRARRNFIKMDVDNSGALTVEEVNASVQAPTTIYTTSLTLHLGGYTVQVHHVPPAHADDMSVILFPDYNTLFAVDFLQIRRFPGGFSGFLAGYQVGNYGAAIDAVLKLDFDRVIQGHGNVIGTKQDAQDFETMLFTTAAAIEEAISEGKNLQETIDAVALPQYKDWSLYETRRAALIESMYESMRP